MQQCETQSVPKVKILLVDDEVEVRRTARQLLSRWGYDTTEAGDGLAAIDAARAARPDLILLDVKMPGMSGMDVLPLLRAHPQLALTPVIIVTGNYSPESHAEAIRMGADDYLSKPFNSVLFRARVASILEKEGLRKELETTRRNFSAMIIHDVSNPLMIVQGFAQLLLEETAAQQNSFVTSSLNRILASAGRALELVAQTLDLSKLEAGGVRLEKRRQNMNSLLNDLAAEQQVLAKRKRIELEVDLKSAMEAEIDPLKMTEVIVNIVSNAIKFTPEGGRVSLSGFEESPGELRIDIRDSGPGIPPDQLETVFAPWKQASVRATNVKGYGLGLAISRMIVEAHGGRIKVDSELGAGTTFSVFVPGYRMAC